MKTVGKIVVLTVVAAVFIGGIVLVGKTNWSDGVREQVRKARAAKQAKMAAEQAKKEAPTAAPQAENPAPSVEKAAGDKDKGAAENPGAAPKKKGKAPKAPQLDGAAFAAFGEYFAKAAVAALLAGGVLAAIRRKKASRDAASRMQAANEGPQGP